MLLDSVWLQEQLLQLFPGAYIEVIFCMAIATATHLVGFLGFTFFETVKIALVGT
jgi:hypothetical protein